MNSSTAVAPTEPITARAVKAPSGGMARRSPEASCPPVMACSVPCRARTQKMTTRLKAATRKETIFSRSS